MDDLGLARVIQERLGHRQLACAESCTAGRVAQVLAGTEGAGQWFRGALVAYQSAVKFEALGVTPGPVVSERAAGEMAAGVARLLDADVAVATTGAAGPEPCDGARPGTVVIGTYRDGATGACTYRFSGDPDQVSAQACTAALEVLAQLLGHCQSTEPTFHE
jgi:nicotinamide-nucleotide amidase